MPSAVFGGALIAIVGMLYASIRDLILAFGFERDVGLCESNNSKQTPEQNASNE